VFDAMNDLSGEQNTGYKIFDITGNGNVDIWDVSIVFDNMNSGVSSINPFTLK
jgi:hypothetical protein